jgi:hypothetical protein
VHTTYGYQIQREITYDQTTVVNACERYVLEIPDRPFPPKHLGKLIWKNGAPKLPDELS